MSSVVISGDTSGAITLAAPAVSGTNTATLPAATGTVMVSGNMPAFSYYKSATLGNQSLTSGTFTKVTFDTSEFDTTSGMFATSKFLPTIAGYYQITTCIAGTPSTSLTRVICSLYKNGSEFKRGFDNNTGTTSNGNGTTTALIYFNGSTDYVEVYGVIVATVALIPYGAAFCYFQGALVRSA